MVVKSHLHSSSDVHKSRVGHTFNSLDPSSWQQTHSTHHYRVNLSKYTIIK
jgi:hypothetical protein